MKMLKTIWKQSKLPLIILAAFFLLSILLPRCQRANLVLTGVGLNAELSEAGVSWIREELAPLLGVGEGQEVAYAAATMTSFNEDPTNENFYMLKNILTLVQENNLDYFLMDKTAMENLIAQGIFLDLTEFFTPEEVERMQTDLIWAVAIEKDETEADMENRCPVALKLTGIPFFAENSPQELYLAISAKTTRLEKCRILWEHILSWE